HPATHETAIVGRPGEASRRSGGAGGWIETTAPGTRGRLLGGGTRAGGLVLVWVDGDGAALAAPVDARGALGREEPFRLLSALAPATARTCTEGRADAEATVLLPFDGALTLEAPSLAGVVPGA